MGSSRDNKYTVLKRLLVVVGIFSIVIEAGVVFILLNSVVGSGLNGILRLVLLKKHIECIESVLASFIVIFPVVIIVTMCVVVSINLREK